MVEYFSGFPKSAISYCLAAIIVSFAVFGLGINVAFNMGAFFSIGIGENVSLVLSNDSGYLIPFLLWAWVPVTLLVLIRHKFCGVTALLLVLLIFLVSLPKLFVTTEYVVVQQTQSSNNFQGRLSFTRDIYDSFTKPSINEVISGPDVWTEVDSAPAFAGGNSLKVERRLGTTAVFDIFPLLILLIGLKLKHVINMSSWYGT